MTVRETGLEVEITFVEILFIDSNAMTSETSLATENGCFEVARATRAPALRRAVSMGFSARVGFQSLAFAQRRSRAPISLGTAIYWDVKRRNVSNCYEVLPS
jgi:hypothetical protein